MSKDKLGDFYIQTHEPKILINDSELVDFIVLESKLENGHSVSKVEAVVKFRGIMDCKLEFRDNSI